MESNFIEEFDKTNFLEDFSFLPECEYSPLESQTDEYGMSFKKKKCRSQLVIIDMSLLIWG